MSGKAKTTCNGRTRKIHPGICTNEMLGVCSVEAQLTADRLSMWADRRGYLEDRPQKIHMHVAPYVKMDMNAVLDELKHAGFIDRKPGINADGEPCGVIVILKFEKHQDPHPHENPNGVELTAGDPNEMATSDQTPTIGEPKSTIGEPRSTNGEPWSTNGGICPSYSLSSSSPSTLREIGYQERHIRRVEPDTPAPDNGKPPKEDMAARFAAMVQEQLTPEGQQGITARAEGMRDWFEKEFWQAVPRPRRLEKEQTWKAILRLKPDAALRRRMVEAMKAQAATPEYQADNYRFMKHPKRWIALRRWEDDLTVHKRPSLEDEVAEINKVRQRLKGEGVAP